MGMISQSKVGLFALLLVLMSTPFALADNTITVYRTSQRSLVNVPNDVSVCTLSVKHSLRLPFSGGLSEANAAHIKSWMKTHQMELKIWEQQTVCRYRADFLNLKYLPAVVMNNTYVVYGHSDVERAIQSINDCRTQLKRQGKHA